MTIGTPEPFRGGQGLVEWLLIGVVAFILISAFFILRLSLTSHENNHDRYSSTHNQAPAGGEVMSEQTPSVDNTIQALDRRIGWLRHALYNIEVGRSYDPRESAHEALRIDDMISGKIPLPEATATLDAGEAAEKVFRMPRCADCPARYANGGCSDCDVP